MAQAKQIVIKSIDSPWDGPIKNGNFTNYEADGTMKGMKGDESVQIVVGSEQMTQKFTVGETYTGMFCGKTDDDRWRVLFQAKSNPALSSSQEQYQGGGSRPSGGHSAPRQNDHDRNKSFAMSYVKDIACASVRAGSMTADDALEFVIKSAPVFELYLDGGIKKADKEPDTEPSGGVEATKSSEPTRDAIADVLKAHDLVRKVGDANLSLDVLKGMWDDDESVFVKRVEERVADDSLPF